MKSLFIIGELLILLKCAALAMTQDHLRILNEVNTQSIDVGPTDMNKDPTKKGETNNNNKPIICNRNLMFSYGMEGYDSPTLDQHQYCPLITQNCCKQEDELNSVKIWNTQLKPTIERYYGVYLKSIKYILGFSPEISKLAMSYKDSTEQRCKHASEDYLQLNLSLKITNEVYRSLFTAIERVSEIRKGFFCFICDGHAHSKLHEYWSSGNKAFHNSVYLSKSFCEKLVGQTVSSAFFTTYYLKRLANSLGTLVSCKTENRTVTQYEIPLYTQNQVKNCYFFKEKYFFFFCENYCEKFHMTNAHPVFDGDVSQLRKFVSLIMAERHLVFAYPNNNVFINSMGDVEDFLQKNLSLVYDDTIFFRPAAQKIMLDNFKSDVVYFGGVDPYESVEDALYQLILDSAIITKVVTFSAMVFMLWS